MTINELLSTFYYLNEEIKKLEGQKKELRDILMQKGNCSSKEFVCTVTEKERQTLKALKEVCKYISMAELLQNELINITKTKTVIVKKK